MIITTMNLTEAGGRKLLAGHSQDNALVYVLEKRNETNYMLHAFDVSTDEQSLRAILSGSQSEHGELVSAILNVINKPIAKPRAIPRRKAKQ